MRTNKINTNSSESSSFLWKLFKLIITCVAIFATVSGRRTIGLTKDPLEKNYGRLIIKAGEEPHGHENPTYKVCFEGWDYSKSKADPHKNIAYEVHSMYPQRSLANDLAIFQENYECDYNSRQNTMSFTQTRDCLEKVHNFNNPRVRKQKSFIDECTNEFKKMDAEHASRDQGTNNKFEL